MSKKNKEQTIEEPIVQDQINEIVEDSHIEELTIEEPNLKIIRNVPQESVLIYLKLQVKR
jgi:hypothetical protein